MKKDFFLISLLLLKICSADTVWQPKISIITSVYKGDLFIEPFLCDITQQTIFDQCELILINANSPGNEEPIIQHYMAHYPNIIYQRLDHDPGLYGVWNRAIEMARGIYITNANLDDRLAPTCYEVHARMLDEYQDIDLVYSDSYWTHGINETFVSNTAHKVMSHPEFSVQALARDCLPGANPMWRKSLHTRYSLFDDRYHIAGDYDLWLRVVQQGARFKKVPGIYGLYYWGGLSTGQEHRERAIAESQQLRPLKNSLRALGNRSVDAVSMPIAVSYDEGMNCTPGAADDNVDWLVLKTVYEQNRPDVITRNAYPLIPKIIHQIWLGSPLPEQYQKLCDTWRKHHPDWEYRLWTDADIQAFGLVNQELFDQSRNYGHKSDIARYEILYRYGGLYVDTDFECLRAVDDLHYRYAFYTCVLPCTTETANGVIGSVPGHPILKACIESVRPVANPYDNNQIMTASGPQLLTKLFLHAIRAGNNYRVIALPQSYFFPFPATERHAYRAGRITRDQVLATARPETFAVHFWENSWQRRFTKC